MRTYQLYYQFTASANDGAHIDIKQSGEIVGIDFELWNTGAPTTGDYAWAELSCASTAQNSNDASGLIASIASSLALTTSGAASMGRGKWVGPMSLPVKAGDRCYLNVTENGGNTWYCRAILHVR